MKKITFAVISCNSETTIITCLEAIKAINYSKEVIVIDDSSKDRTVELAKPYSDKIIIKNRDEKGISISRNIALKEANGDYLFIIDADIEVKSLNIKSMIDFIESNNLVAISGSYRSEEFHRNDLGFLLDIRRQRIFFKNNKTYVYELHNYTTFSGGFCCIARTKVLNEIQFKIALGFSAEDLIWQISLLKEGYKFGYYKEFQGVHHHRRNVRQIFSKCLSEARGGLWLIKETIKFQGFPPVLEQVSYIPFILILAFLSIFINPLIAAFLIVLELLPYLLIIFDKRISIKSYFVFLFYFLICKLGFLYYFLQSILSKNLSLKLKYKLIIFSLYSDFLAKFTWIKNTIKYGF